MKTISIMGLTGALATAAALAGCVSGVTRVAPGASAADVRASAGAPTEERELGNGMKAWFYESGPNGWTTYRVRLDGTGHVVDREQVLTEKSFRAELMASKTSRNEVLDRLGRPSYVSRFPNLSEEVWTYRYLDGTLEMLNDVHIDAASGIVRSYSMYRDPAYSVSLG